MIDIIQKGKGKNHIEENLKKKLRNIIQTDIEFQSFKEEYSKEVESKLVSQATEKRSKNVYYNFVENKAEINRELTNLTPPLNPDNPDISVMPHDHIHPQHFLKNPKEVENNKIKYLAYFDIIIDQHIRHVRPKQLHDNRFKFVKKQYIPDIFENNEIANNEFIEYKFNLDNEFFLKAQNDIENELKSKCSELEEEHEDPVFK